MKMKKYALFKIKEGKKEEWVRWCDELMSRKNEAILTLQEENLIKEWCVISGDYVFCGYETVEGKEKLPMNKEREINQKHYQIFHECLETVEGEPAIIGYDIEVN